MTRIVSFMAGLAIIVAAATATSTAQADIVLQLDLGGGTVFDGTNNATNAPAGIADTFYNGISGNANPTDSTFTGLVFGDGTAATGVSAQIGDGAGTALFDGTFPTANNNGSDAGTDLTNDWIFTRNNDNLGVRVTGLDAGLYDVYALVREANALDRTYDVGIGVDDTGDIADLTTQSIGAITDNSVFTAGGNFVVQRVEVVNSTDFITVIVDPTNAAFATLGGIQIVGVATVPEPSSLALLSLGGLGFIVRRRRR